MGIAPYTVALQFANNSIWFCSGATIQCKEAICDCDLENYFAGSFDNYVAIF